jgi:5-methylcytosine-specific restriction enzyme A
MATYLFTWNPARWNWEYLQENIAEVKENGYCKESWSCGVTKKIRSGDRAFLIKLGKGKRGIFASGWVTSNVYKANNWDINKKNKALYVDIDWDTLLDPEENIFSRDLLDTAIYSKMHWEPQASGTTIPEDVAEQLEKDWASFIGHSFVIKNPPLAEEIETKTFPEGASHQVTINTYERNPEARTICINHYGLNCFVCGFNFKNTYGIIGEGFIHVHHLKPISEIGRGYKINPIKDLRPVCPNCHAMLHQRKPAYSIEELKTILKQNR